MSLGDDSLLKTINTCPRDITGQVNLSVIISGLIFDTLVSSSSHLAPYDVIVLETKHLYLIDLYRMELARVRAYHFADSFLRAIQGLVFGLGIFSLILNYLLLFFTWNNVFRVQWIGYSGSFKNSEFIDIFDLQGV